MGRATRWFLGLLGGGKLSDGRSPAENRPAKEKKRWGFMKSFREKEKDQDRRQHLPQPSENRKGSYTEVRIGSTSDGDEQGKHAIAVAAATAAVAEAAVATAQAAAAVVRLTGSGSSVGLGASRVMRGEEWDAIKIQAAFRGYLARRALRALRSLVKLQALVRGNIVRKQAAETLRCMQALVRVQARAHACRALRSEASVSSRSSRSNPVAPSAERYEHPMRSNPSRTGSFKRNSSRKTGTECAQKDGNHSEHWNWLDQWIEERYFDGGEGPKTMDDENNAKILEIDNAKPPQFTSKRRTKQLTSSSPISSKQNSQTIPSKDSTNAQQSNPSPSSTFVMPDSNSPREGSPPTNCEYSQSLFSGCSDCPNYMTNTESSRAKARSHSAPKQRPDFEKSSSVKRLSDQGFSGQRSSLQAKFANKAYPGSGRLDRLGMPMKS